MPNYCSNTITHIGSSKINWRRLGKKLKKWNGINFKKYITPVKEGITGDIDMLEFNRQYWGTKWNALETQVNIIEDRLNKTFETTINFDTAWTPPNETLSKYLLEDIADILGVNANELKLKYSEIGFGIEGEYYIHQGKIYNEELTDNESKSCNSLELEDYEDVLELESSDIRIYLRERSIVGYYGDFNQKDVNLIAIKFIVNKQNKIFYISKRDIGTYSFSNGYHYIKFNNCTELLINQNNPNDKFIYQVYYPYLYKQVEPPTKYISKIYIEKTLSKLYKIYSELTCKNK